MLKKRSSILIICGITGAVFSVAKYMKKKADHKTYSAKSMKPIPVRKMGFYEKHMKRGLDVVCASTTITALFPLYIVLAVLVKIKLGSPIIFSQERPGIIGDDGKETIFRIYKFRTMTDDKDETGKRLPDEVRLTSFGKKLRASSLDELPEVINILNGTMSVIGPRPQLVRDMVFMTDDQRIRHTAKPGLSGLAQIKGRNAITWEEKIEWDMKYIERIGFQQDLLILLKTIKKLFARSKHPEASKEVDLAMDYGDELLDRGVISKQKYDDYQEKARLMLGRKA